MFLLLLRFNDFVFNDFILWFIILLLCFNFHYGLIYNFCMF